MITLLYRALLVLIFFIPSSDCLVCSSCHEVGDEALCTTTQICQQNQSCYRSSIMVNNKLVITGGCVDSNLCNVGIENLIGRDVNLWTRRQVDTCFECCSSDQCNNALCHRQKPLYADCSEIKRNNPNTVNGIYDIILWKSKRQIQVYCDMTTDGGGWTVFENRFNGMVDFYRNITDYINGFGNLHSEFWLGLDFVQEMVSRDMQQIRLDFTASNGTTGYLVASNFSLGLGPGSEYTLQIGEEISSRNGDVMTELIYHTSSPTRFPDPDKNGHRNCSLLSHEVLFYKWCAFLEFNERYLKPGSIVWTPIFLPSLIELSSLKTFTIEFRPSQT